MSTPAAPGGLVAIVARRELAARLRDRVFIGSTLFLLLIVAGSVLLPLLLTDDGAPRYTVAVTGQRADQLGAAAQALGREAIRAQESREAAGGTGAGAPGGAPAAQLTLRPASDVAAAEQLVRDGTADVALVQQNGVDAVQIIGDDDVPGDLHELVSAVARQDATLSALEGSGVTAEQVQTAIAAAEPTERLLDPPSKEAELALPLTFVFAMLFFTTTFLFGMAIAQSVVEEKQSRIVEILVAAVPVRLLLAGKVLGNTVLALAQTVLLVAVGLGGAALGGQGDLVGLIAGSSAWFLLFFVIGFLMLSCVWAASGAVAGRQEDLQATTVPVQVLVFAGLFAGVYVYSPGPLLTALSYIPFTAPLTMPRRLLIGDAAWWEAVLSAGIMLVTAAALVALAARIYQRALLRTGSRTTWATALGLGRR